jgi:hypothetical protein
LSQSANLVQIAATEEVAIAEETTEEVVTEEIIADNLSKIIAKPPRFCLGVFFVHFRFTYAKIKKHTAQPPIHKEIKKGIAPPYFSLFLSQIQPKFAAHEHCFRLAKRLG